MTLTVRLDESMATALAEHCAAHGTSKSRVVQQSLAAYLLQAAIAVPAAATRHAPSPAFIAFEAAGLLGSGVLGTAPADKAAVRRRIITGA